MRILIWHGYLLGGTGSNVYTRMLAREWSRAGHDVTVFSQEAQPDLYDLGGAETVRPDVGRLLPVFVLDRYAGYDVKLLQDCTRAELDAWVEANAAAVRERLPADLLVVNHALLGGAVGAASGTRYVVKVHGSELEYSMRGRPELEAWGREVLAGPRPRSWAPAHPRGARGGLRTRARRARGATRGRRRRLAAAAPYEALADLVEESRRDPPNPGNADERLPDEGNAERLGAFLSSEGPTVVYFGKLLYNKGVHVLLEALREVDARAVLVGFGDYRDELERLADPQRTLFTGPLEHRHLTRLLPLADVTVVPSIFPEAFGMVAAEAAAAGSPPIVAHHSGLAEVAAGLEAEYPAPLRGLASFRTGDAADLAAKLRRLLSLDPSERAELSAAARRAVERRWSWAGIAARILEEA